MNSRLSAGWLALMSACAAVNAMAADPAAAPRPTQRDTAASSADPAATATAPARRPTGSSTASAASTPAPSSPAATAVVAARTDGSSDTLSGLLVDDKDLAQARGGSAINENNSTATVAGNVASQVTTGSNTITDNAFANTSGIPIVIQNTGNNVLIQDSTILNLQLTNPK